MSPLDGPTFLMDSLKNELDVIQLGFDKDIKTYTDRLNTITGLLDQLDPAQVMGNLAIKGKLVSFVFTYKGIDTVGQWLQEKAPEMTKPFFSECVQDCLSVQRSEKGKRLAELGEQIPASTHAQAFLEGAEQAYQEAYQAYEKSRNALGLNNLRQSLEYLIQQEPSPESLAQLKVHLEAAEALSKTPIKSAKADFEILSEPGEGQIEYAEILLQRVIPMLGNTPFAQYTAADDIRELVESSLSDPEDLAENQKQYEQVHASHLGNQYALEATDDEYETAVTKAEQVGLEAPDREIEYQTKKQIAAYKKENGLDGSDKDTPHYKEVMRSGIVADHVPEEDEAFNISKRTIVYDETKDIDIDIEIGAIEDLEKALPTLAALKELAVQKENKLSEKTEVLAKIDEEIKRQENSIPLAKKNLVQYIAQIDALEEQIKQLNRLTIFQRFARMLGIPESQSSKNAKLGKITAIQVQKTFLNGSITDTQKTMRQAETRLEHLATERAYANTKMEDAQRSYNRATARVRDLEVRLPELKHIATRPSASVPLATSASAVAADIHSFEKRRSLGSSALQGLEAQIPKSALKHNGPQ